MSETHPILNASTRGGKVVLPAADATLSWQEISLRSQSPIVVGTYRVVNTGANEIQFEVYRAVDVAADGETPTLDVSFDPTAIASGTLAASADSGVVDLDKPAGTYLLRWKATTTASTARVELQAVR